MPSRIVARLSRFVVILGLIALAVSVATPAGGTGERTVGLLLNAEGSFDGYTLLAPMRGETGTVYLLDNDGERVHSWDTGSSEDRPTVAYLLEDGSVVRARTGGVRRVAWDGTLVWDYTLNGLHHDVEVLPNGNVLMIVRDIISAADAVAAGRNPSLLEGGMLLVDAVIEVEPTGPTSGTIVWEWHAWDHLVQDHDAARTGYAIVADHPELIDVNYFDQTRPPAGEIDWLHANAIDYNEALDQIILSPRNFSELWVIDHSTTTAEAAGHTGGKSGRGGDVLYRWGNPQAYGAGDADDQQLFLAHDTQWIEPGLPGEGNILVFNNGNGRTSGNSSSVDEIVPPVDGLGNYPLTPGQAYGPVDLAWTFAGPPDFYSALLSGAVRLPNGNTLITAGVQGTIFEVTPAGSVVWKYVNPVTATGMLRQDDSIQGRPNSVFRAYRYGLDYPAFQGRSLMPAGPIEIPKPAPATTPTNTPPLETLLGDVDCSGSVDSIDAALVLQYGAGLLGSLPCADAGDVTGDGVVNVDDAVVILQHEAGLLVAERSIDSGSYSTPKYATLSRLDSALLKSAKVSRALRATTARGRQQAATSEQ